MKHCPVPVNVTFFLQIWTNLNLWGSGILGSLQRVHAKARSQSCKAQKEGVYSFTVWRKKPDNVVFRMLTSSSSCLYEKDKLVRMFLSFCISYEIWHSDQLIYLLLTLFSLNWLKLFYLPSKIDSSEVWHENEYLQRFITFWGGNGKWGTTTFLLCLLCSLSRL